MKKGRKRANPYKTWYFLPDTSAPNGIRLDLHNEKVGSSQHKLWTLRDYLKIDSETHF